MASTQNMTVEGLLSTLGLYGYSSLSAAANGDDNTQLDITVTPPAWGIVGDGTVLTAELVDASVTDLTADGSYSLYLDYEDAYDGRIAVWTVAASAPSSRAIVVASVTVASGVISAVTLTRAGINGSALEALNIASPVDSYRTVVLADSPLAYWPLDDSSSGAVDASGSGLNLTAIGSGITTGQAGPGTMTAMHFDGSSRLERDGSTSLPSGQDPWTLECWVRRDSSGGDNMLVQIGNRADFGDMYTLHADGDGTGVNPYWGGYDLHIGGLPSMVTSWRHYVVTFNGLRRTVYIDGVVVGADGSDQTGETFTNGKISIGAQSSGGDGWVGSLCQVAVYDHVLSGDRVLAHFTAAGA